MNGQKPSKVTSALNAVLLDSEDLTGVYPVVKGYDFNEGVNYAKLMRSYETMGYQGTNFGKAINEINRMRNWRLSDEPMTEQDDVDEKRKDPQFRAITKCTIFLGYTSNLISSGLRENIRFLAQHKLVDVIVTTAGGIEEDFIKCLGDTFVGDFDMQGAGLRRRGINRIGNLLVPNANYCKFEDWITPILDQMVLEQKEGVVWSPSSFIHRLGKEIDNEESVYYWCYKNQIPVFCPAITDGSIGDMIYFHSYRNAGLVIDLVSDIRLLNDIAIHATKTGVIILGGGIVKHHILNANLMRNGADFSVFVNTGQEFDGSDAGARPDEAISWGKIRIDAKPVKLYCDATLVFPLLVAETFAKNFQENKA
ncbi:unnamed protein product [Albugo candida]|uniref:deoxyhypusine synthase n=1 Tax=Albugo candida TaxID=65357 RepID=A0A024GSR0_9STRA|nr:unnamed protein product [Albugo candida]|eukprot:CCI49771.1 unnamed protein product [Albugo candida]